MLRDEFQSSKRFSIDLQFHKVITVVVHQQEAIALEWLVHQAIAGCRQEGHPRTW